MKIIEMEGSGVETASNDSTAHLENKTNLKFYRGVVFTHPTPETIVCYVYLAR